MPRRLLLPTVIMRIIVPCVALLAVGAACPPQGESGFSVKGRLTGVAEGQSCELALNTATDNVRRASRSIGARFDTAFTIPARESEYYFVITCPGTTGEYRSQPIRIGPHSQHDLGDVTLRP
jgi:hypothetical protein